MDLYTGRCHSKIGLNFALAIFPLLLVFLYGQKNIQMPTSTRIVVLEIALFFLPLALGGIGIFLGFKGYRENDDLGMFVMILSIASLLVTLWFSFWTLHDLSFLYKYGFLTS